MRQMKSRKHSKTIYKFAYFQIDRFHIEKINIYSTITDNAVIFISKQHALINLFKVCRSYNVKLQ